MIIPNIAVWVTFTRDLETEGHVMVYVTYAISACICPTAIKFFLFHKIFRSRNSTGGVYRQRSPDLYLLGIEIKLLQNVLCWGYVPDTFEFNNGISFYSSWCFFLKFRLFVFW